MKTGESWFIAVTSGRWQRHGIREAKTLGYKVLAIDADPVALGFAFADKRLCISFADHSVIIEELRKLNLNYVGAVSFCSEVGMMLAARIREAFDLPGPRIDLCRKLLDKSLQRKLWSEKGVPGPEKFLVFSDIKTAAEAATHFTLPFIIKPIDSSGSRGVTKIESLADDYTKAIERAFSFSRSQQVIMESYMDGTEFTVEVFVHEGNVNVLAVTEKKKVEGTRGTVARELATPDRPVEVIEKLSNAVIAACKALGYDNGPGHAEIILIKNGEVGMVEFAGRGGGFMVFDKLVPAASGVSIAKLTILQATNRPIGPIQIHRKAVVLRFFPSTPGTLTEISGFEDANQIEGVEAAPFAMIGATISKASADEDRMGYILTKANTAAEAQRLTDKAESMIHFDIIQSDDH